jgi:hypothetical protein
MACLICQVRMFSCACLGMYHHQFYDIKIVCLSINKITIRAWNCDLDYPHPYLPIEVYISNSTTRVFSVAIWIVNGVARMPS